MQNQTKQKPRRGRPPVQTGIDVVSMAEQIKEAAIELFFHNSFPATSIRDIASACGVTPGALYNHYSSKDELLYVIVNQSIVALSSELDAIRAQGVKNSTDELYKFIYAYTKFHTLNPHASLVANTYFEFLTEDYRNRVHKERVRFRKVFEDVIAKGVDEGYFELAPIGNKQSVRRVTIAMVDMVRVAEWYKPELGYDPSEIADFYASLALRMVNAKRKKSSRKVVASLS